MVRIIRGPLLKSLSKELLTQSIIAKTVASETGKSLKIGLRQGLKTGVSTANKQMEYMKVFAGPEKNLGEKAKIEKKIGAEGTVMTIDVNKCGRNGKSV